MLRKLLGERAESGESFAALAARSGIPAGTLAAYSRRIERESTPSRAGAFVELVAKKNASSSASRPTLAVVVDAPSGSRRILVPSGFEPTELQRLISVLEAEEC